MINICAFYAGTDGQKERRKSIDLNDVVEKKAIDSPKLGNNKNMQRKSTGSDGFFLEMKALRLRERYRETLKQFKLI